MSIVVRGRADLVDVLVVVVVVVVVAAAAAVVLVVASVLCLVALCFVFIVVRQG